MECGISLPDYFKFTTQLSFTGCGWAGRSSKPYFSNHAKCKTSPRTYVCGFSTLFHVPQERTLPYNIFPTERIHYRIYEFSSDFSIWVYRGIITDCRVGSVRSIQSLLLNEKLFLRVGRKPMQTRRLRAQERIGSVWPRPYTKVQTGH